MASPHLGAEAHGAVRGAARLRLALVQSGVGGGLVCWDDSKLHRGVALDPQLPAQHALLRG
jgi:hypothetical protein